MFFEKVRISGKLRNLITIVGSTTFGIYLLEYIIRTETRPILRYLKQVIGTFPAGILWIISCFLVGVLVVLLLKKIPIVRKLF